MNNDVVTVTLPEERVVTIEINGQTYVFRLPPRTYMVRYHIVGDLPTLDYRFVGGEWVTVEGKPV